MLPRGVGQLGDYYWITSDIYFEFDARDTIDNLLSDRHAPDNDDEFSF